MNKTEIDEIEKRAASRVNLKVSPINSETTLKLIAHVRRLEKLRDAVYECDAGNHYMTGLPLHEKLLDALKACEEADGE